jgi:hypothetical protein
MDRIVTISEYLCDNEKEINGWDIQLSFILIVIMAILLLFSWTICCCACRKSQIRKLKKQLIEREKCSPSFQMVSPCPV